LTTNYILGQKFVKFFVGYLENLRLSKRHSEINWPLGIQMAQALEGMLMSSNLMSKAEFAAVGTFFTNRFPSLRFFVNNKVGNQEN
jgi:hypothetical protein